MKKSFVIIQSFLLLFLCSSCGSTEKLLINTWELDTVPIIQVTIKNMKKEGKSKREISAMVGAVQSIFGGITANIKSDGTIEISVIGQIQEGEWRLNKNIITITDDEKGEEMKLKIISISDKKLVVAPAGDNEDLEEMHKMGLDGITLIPVE